MALHLGGFEQAAASRLGGEGGDARGGGGGAAGPAERVGGVAHDVAQAVGPSEGLGGVAKWRVVVEGEGLERLDLVAAMQVDEQVAAVHELGEDVVGERLGERPV